MKQILSRDKIASSSPQKLVKEPLFWLNTQKYFVFVLSFALFVVLVFFRYTYSEEIISIANLLNRPIFT